MKRVIMTGATGMVGNLVLEYCLESDEVEQVTSIVRRPSGKDHAKLVEVVHQNFLDYSDVEDHFKGQDICYFCIGVYTGTVPRDKFREITVDYTREFAKTLHQHSPGAAFCFLSGQGADSTEKSRIMFAKDKGIAENLLFRQGFSRVHSFRPGYIYPVVARKEPNFSYKFMRALYKPVSAIYPNIGLTSEQLATSMFTVGLQGGDQKIYENKEIKAVLGM